MIYSIGEILFDYLIDTKTNKIEKNEGGAPANVAVLIKRLKGDPSFLASISKDTDGELLYNFLKNEGVNLTYVKRVSNPSMKAFVRLNNGDRSFEFFRNETADLNLDLDSVKDLKFNPNDFIHFCSVSLKGNNNQIYHKSLIMKANEALAWVSFDVNLRHNLWENKDELKFVVKEFIGVSSIVKLSLDELSFLFEKPLKEAVFEIFEGFTKVVIISDGANGASIYIKDKSFHQDAPKVDVIDTTGAGDALIGSILYQMEKRKVTLHNYKDAKWDEILKFSVDLASYTVTKKGAITSYQFYKGKLMKP